ncbi:hypothetical protein UMM65_16630 [Aureibaculum sp. 2210JD6-5]|uniref:hypothetical protein n=1 Tax=Aureibaculum sp. 2210JD6-5 TaxID=3103957 RepID=UPI002AAE09F4|nr:hypothetical protein [Aureibaculum sp. 2210JD6-5]MDY7396874.1 hypothetical protein [Aureibaculum sp. 2210JD6-5]
MSCFNSKETKGLNWKPIVYYALIKVVDILPILEIMKNSIEPNSWSGSKAAILNKRIILFDKLFNHGNENVKSWAIIEKKKFLKYIEEVRDWETERNRKRHESFE